MRVHKSNSFSLALVLLTISLTGCSRPSQTQSPPSEPMAFEADTSANGLYFAKSSPNRGYADSSASGSYAMEEAYFDEAAYDEDVYSGSSTAVEAETSSPVTEESGEIRPEKLVYTGSLTVETIGFDSTLSRIRQMITDLGGFIESENDSDNAYGWYLESYSKSSSTLSAYIQARIPSGSFYEFMDGVEGEGARVTNRSVNVDNISRQYSETATTIESYEIQERRLLEMMENATRVSDMLEIEGRLSEVQGYLKQYRNSLSAMDTDVAYSTVSISIREVGFYSEPEATSFTEKLSDSFTNGLAGFKRSLEDLCIWLVGNFLDILVAVFVIWLLVRLIKRLIARRAKGGKKEKKNPTAE
ncbi:MAG: DUF4349 domain-containing protein [Blautia sp.]|nr:DUF4349 domain-containing protein [Blautia sp.]